MCVMMYGYVCDVRYVYICICVVRMWYMWYVHVYVVFVYCVCVWCLICVVYLNSV